VRLSDVSKQMEKKGVPGGKRIRDLPCCYYCNNMVIQDLRNWKCAKYEIDFGPDGRTAVALQAEFVCDDYEPC